MSLQKKPTPVIELRNLTKRFGIGEGEATVLNDVNLTIEKGDFIAIMGPSGCGKTTLLNMLGLLDYSDEGSYRLDGQDVEDLNTRAHAKIRAERIGFIFQSFNLVPRLTVLENVALPLTYKGASYGKRIKAASEMLKNFHLSEREYYMPWQLSGGQTQRVAIARALVNNPSIILADEPTGNLDSKSSHIIMQELSDVHQRGNTIIMVTHNPDLTTYANRVITMLDGKIDTDTRRDAESDDFPLGRTPGHKKTRSQKPKLWQKIWTSLTGAERRNEEKEALQAKERKRIADEKNRKLKEKKAKEIAKVESSEKKRPLGLATAKPKKAVSEKAEKAEKTKKADSTKKAKNTDDKPKKTNRRTRRELARKRRNS